MAHKDLLIRARQGDPEAQLQLGLRHYRGEGCPPDPVTAADWVFKAAQSDLAEAQFVLGAFHQNGEGVIRDPAQAAIWYRKAAEQGHVGAQFNLGYALETGEGVDANREEAISWYQKAAGHGDQDAIEALRELGLWEEGDPGPEEELERRAGDGDATAQYQLGIRLAREDSAAKDLKRGVQLLIHAAEQNHAGAQSALGALHHQGLGMPQDLPEAVRLYRLAAEQGHATAQFNLGYCYEIGDGVDQNEDEAILWYAKAAEQGDEEATAALAELKANHEPVAIVASPQESEPSESATEPEQEGGAEVTAETSPVSESQP